VSIFNENQIYLVYFIRIQHSLNSKWNRKDKLSFYQQYSQQHFNNSHNLSKLPYFWGKISIITRYERYLTLNHYNHYNLYKFDYLIRCFIFYIFFNQNVSVPYSKLQHAYKCTSACLILKFKLFQPVVSLLVCLERLPFILIYVISLGLKNTYFNSYRYKFDNFNKLTESLQIVTYYASPRIFENSTNKSYTYDVQKCSIYCNILSYLKTLETKTEESYTYDVQNSFIYCNILSYIKTLETKTKEHVLDSNIYIRLKI
jgi:hypothetical protein